MNGPEPTNSLIWSVPGVSAMRLGMMKGLPEGFDSACSTTPVGDFSTIWKVLASTAFSSATFAHRMVPRLSRDAQRFSEAITSSVVTGWPSWNSSPSRSVKVQVSLSSLIFHVSTICGLILSSPSSANSVS